VLSLTNPQNVAYWAAIGTALGALGVQEPTASDYTTFFAGFMASSVVWSFCFAALVDRALRQAGARWAQLTYRACAIAFLALALSSLRDLWISRYPSATVRQPSAIAGEP
jgi:chemosensory pili system protein ChpE/L-lysine exporter family protein LysE/ArgO